MIYFMGTSTLQYLYSFHQEANPLCFMDQEFIRSCRIPCKDLNSYLLLYWIKINVFLSCILSYKDKLIACM